MYEFIRSYIRDHQKPPTMAEIGNDLSIRSTNAVFKFVVALERKGYLTRTPRVARGIALTQAGDPLSFSRPPPLLPIIGAARSDQPEQLRHHPAGALHVDARLLGPTDADVCLVTIAGDDGMSKQGIRMGDFLIVEETNQEQLFSGELVAVVIGERIMVRSFDFSRNRLHLLPSARGYAAESFAPDSPGCHVIGRVLSVMRKL